MSRLTFGSVLISQWNVFWPANHLVIASWEIIPDFLLWKPQTPWIQCSRLQHQTPPSSTSPCSPLLLDPRDCKECVPPKLPRRSPFGGRGMPGVSLLGLFSQCKQASTFLLVNWSRPHKRTPTTPHLPVQPPLPHPSPDYCQSTPNTGSTADRNHVEELLVSIEPRMCLYNSKNWAISTAVGVVFLWLWKYKKQTVTQIKDQETRARVNWK